jgi:hypothetical protein
MALARVSQEVERHLDDLLTTWRAHSADHQRGAVDEVLTQLETELDQRVKDAVEQARQEWQSAHELQVEAARRDADERVDRVIREREETHRHELEAIAAQAEDRIRQLQQEWHESHDHEIDVTRHEADDRVQRAQTDAMAAERAARMDAEQRIHEATTVWAATEERLQADLRLAEAQATEAVQALAGAERAVRAGEREAMLEGLQRLLDSVERLDQCTSLKATLDVLGQCAAAEAVRSLVLLVRSDELRGWHLHGFADAPEVSTIKLPVAESGGVADAVARGSACYLETSALEGALAFGRLPDSRMGIAVPIVLGHATVAVVYADDGGSVHQAVPAGWPEVIQVLARHASRHLEALTAARAVRLAGVGVPGGGATSGVAASMDARQDAGESLHLVPSGATSAKGEERHQSLGTGGFGGIGEGAAETA